MEYTAIVIILALAQYFWFTVRTGSGRLKYKVEAPHTTGDERWERLFRVQQNTLEQLIVFIPALVLCTYYLSPRWSWIVGVVFIVGRQLYSSEYVNDPKSRGPGMIVTVAANVLLLIGALAGLGLRLF